MFFLNIFNEIDNLKAYVKAYVMVLSVRIYVASNLKDLIVYVSIVYLIDNVFKH